MGAGVLPSADCHQVGAVWALEPPLRNFPEKMRSLDLWTDRLISTANQKVLSILFRKTNTCRPDLARGSVLFNSVIACHASGEHSLARAGGQQDGRRHSSEQIAAAQGDGCHLDGVL